MDMSDGAVVNALLVAVRSDAMLIAAILSFTGTYVVGATIQRRAVAPSLHWRQAFVSAAHDEAHSISGALRLQRIAATPPDASGSEEVSHHSRARLAATLATAAFLGLAGALAIALSGHPPAPIVALVPASAAAIAAVVTAARLSRPLATRAVLVRQGARLVASSLFVEVSAATAMVVTVAVVVHTAGLTAVSLVEVAAITLATRLAVSLTPWPGGLGVADVTLLVPLMWIGVPLHVALAAVLIWRAGSVLAVTAAVVVARRTRMAPTPPPGPATTDGGRILHRALFGSLSLLPQGLRDTARRTVFDALFALSDDPWGYQEVAYERRKQDHLLAAVRSDARTVVEVGCADGHNLVALARRRPDLRIIGTDVSSSAVALAIQRTHELPNIRVVQSEDFDELSAEAHGHIDCVILAEVLYYLGTERSMRDTLEPVRKLMSPDCNVILLHGSADATALHERAMRALELRGVVTQPVDDPERPFVVTVAVRRSDDPTW
jgi:hypothetical protein